MKKSVSDLAAKKENTLEFSEKVGFFSSAEVSFINKIRNIGFGSTILYRAYKSILSMSNSKILLCYTSNIVSSGVRELILELVKKRKVDALLTTGGGVEEDIIKSLDTPNVSDGSVFCEPHNSFYLADFSCPGKALRDNGFNRIGNLVVPNENYEEFEKFIHNVLNTELKSGSKTFSVNEFCKLLGKNSNNSILHYAFKNEIPVFASGVVDGSIGDILTFSKMKIEIDLVRDADEFCNFFNASPTGAVAKDWSVIILGDGSIRYRVINNIRNIKNLVIITTRDEYDGCDIGASLSEKAIKVVGDASILFPLLMEETFLKKE